MIHGPFNSNAWTLGRPSRLKIASLVGELHDLNAMKLTSTLGLISIGLLTLAWAPACSPDSGNGPGGDGDISTGDGDGDGNGGSGTIGGIGDGDGDVTGGGSNPDNPATCAEADLNKSYVGCEFWPTMTYNKVHSGFDFAVVLSNGGAADATVTVSGGALGAPQEHVVPAGGLKAITLPWVPALKGSDWVMENTSGGRADAATVKAVGGAYKVVSSVPVTAWQFNPLQYEKPEVSPCYTKFKQASCFSVSNDASILIPTAALTGNYRAYTFPGDNAGQWGSMAGGIAITATKDNTKVTVQFGPQCEHENNGNPGTCTTGVDGALKAPGSTEELVLNAGDVVEYVATRGAGENNLKNADMSGSIVVADQPVQLIAFNPLANVPDSVAGHGNADHLEEIILPGEVIGKDYIVAAPTSPNGAVRGGHIVRMVGNVDGTTLTYDTQPAGAPATLAAGEVVQFETEAPFRVTGSESFALASIMFGGWKQASDAGCQEADGHPCSGDPAVSMAVTPEQFRTSYNFLAPTDYEVNFADVLVPDGASVSLNGAALTTVGEPVTAGWSIHRVPLSGTDGSHLLTSDQPVGLQVMGFGHATSYYYPGGLNLKLISKPPVIVK